MDPTLANLIDVCAGTRASEFDVAQVLHHLGHARFKYVGDNNWLYRVDRGDSEYEPDARLQNLQHFCSSDVVNVFLQRALHFQDLLAQNPKSNYDVRVKRLLDVSNKLGNPKYVKDVLREAKSFFEQA